MHGKTFMLMLMLKQKKTPADEIIKQYSVTITLNNNRAVSYSPEALRCKHPPSCQSKMASLPVLHVTEIYGNANGSLDDLFPKPYYAETTLRIIKRLDVEYKLYILYSWDNSCISAHNGISLFLSSGFHEYLTRVSQQRNA